MAKFVPDVRSNRWVVIAPARVTRPHDNPSFPGTPAQEQIAASPDEHRDPRNDNKCPFCPGQEGLNKEVLVIARNEMTKQSHIYEIPRFTRDDKVRSLADARDDAKWLVRVIANKYPITNFHEVIIHSPDHDKDIDELPTEQVELIFNVYRQRYNYYKDKGTVMIFNNHDIHAGASLKHPHSQLVVVPKQINLDAMKKEPVQNVVVESKEFVAYCPDFSQWPYEIWLAPNSVIPRPQAEESHIDMRSLANARDDTFGSITDDQIKDLAPLLQKILKVVVNRFNLPAGRQEKEDDIPYNFYIYHGADWYLRIIPRLIHRAGFELGTGLSVNIVDPTIAAKEYFDGINSIKQ